MVVKNYPSLELPVARFTRPEDASWYQGASALANLVLRRAINHETEYDSAIRRFFAARKLWLTATFKDPHRRLLHTDIQVGSDTLWLKAQQYQRAFAMRWTRQQDGTYVPDMVRQEDPVLPDPGDQKSLAITPQTYDTLPTHNQFQIDPALRFSAVFSQHSQELGALPHDYARPVSVGINVLPTI